MSQYQYRLDLQYGQSTQSAACFWPGTPTGSISIGTQGAWRVAAIGVAEYVAYVYFDGSNLFVTSVDPSAPVIVNGSPLPRGYRAVEHGDMIDFGQARLVVSSVPATAEQYIAAPLPIGTGPAPPPFVSASEGPPVRRGRTVILDTRTAEVRDSAAPAAVKPQVAQIQETRAVDLAELRRDPNIGANFGVPLAQRDGAAPSEPPPTRVRPQALRAEAPPAAPPQMPVTKRTPSASTEVTTLQKIILALLPVAGIAMWFTIGPGKAVERESGPPVDATTDVNQARSNLQDESTIPPAASTSPDDETASTAEAPSAETAAPPDVPSDARQRPPLPAGSSAAVDAVGLTAARRAADALIAGDFSSALARYQALEQTEPDNPAYRAMTRILQQRITGSGEGAK